MIPSEAKIIQVAWVVPDAEAAAAHLAKVMKLGPFIRFQHVQVTDYFHRGVARVPDFSMCAAQAGDVQYELIEQHDDTPSVYLDLPSNGLQRFHHVGIMVPDVAAETARLNAQGFETGCAGRFGAAEFTYVDTSPLLGHMLEVLPDIQQMRDFFAMVRNAHEGWDGKSLFVN